MKEFLKDPKLILNFGGLALAAYVIYLLVTNVSESVQEHNRAQMNSNAELIEAINKNTQTLNTLNVLLGKPLSGQKLNAPLDGSR